MSAALDNPTGLTLATAVRMAYAAGNRVRDDVLAHTLTPATAALAHTAADAASQVLATVQTPAGRLYIDAQVQRAMQAAQRLRDALEAAAPTLASGQAPTEEQQRTLLTAALVLRVQLKICDVELREDEPAPNARSTPNPAPVVTA